MIRNHLRSIGAWILLAGIFAGIPALLLAIGANPIAGLPPLEQWGSLLTQPDDGQLLLGVLKLVAWLVWAAVVVSLIVELVLAARRLKIPEARRPSVPNRLGAKLATAALVAVLSVPLTGQLAHAAPATPVSSPVATATANTEPAAPSVRPETTTDTSTSAKEDSAAATTSYVTKAGDTLWSIAATHLGDGSSYPQIHELNRDVLGSDPGFLPVGLTLQLPASSAAHHVTVAAGDTLSAIALRTTGDARNAAALAAASQIANPDVLMPGQIITIPSNLAATTAPTEPTPSPPVAPAPDPSPAPAPAPDPSPTPAPAPTTDPTAASSSPASTLDQPSASPTDAASSAPTVATNQASSEPVPAASTVDTAAAPEQHDMLNEAPWLAAGAVGVSALAAAGVVSLVAYRRRRQQRHRRPGQELPMPTGAAAHVEEQLRASADPMSVDIVDKALRGLAAHCTRTKTELPRVRAARLTADQFDLYLAAPAGLPSPWVRLGDDTIWTLPVDAVVADVDDDQPSPYPALVTIGHDEDQGHVLLDLEELGLLGIAGDRDRGSQIMAALAIELATSKWADDLQVTVVGAWAELEDAVQSGRIRYLPSIARALDDLESRAGSDRAAFASAGATGLRHARVAGLAPDTWHPEILLIAGDIPQDQHDQLNDLVNDLPRVSIAAVLNGPVADDDWSLHLTPGVDEAVIEPVGLPILPQAISRDAYEQLLEVAAIADLDEIRYDQPPSIEPSLAELDAAMAYARDHDNGTNNSPQAETKPEQRGQEDGPSPDLVVEPDVEQEDVRATGTLPELTDEPMSPAAPVRLRGPQVLLIGTPDLVGVDGPVESSKRGRLLEYAAYLVTHPGAGPGDIDDAIWPDRTKPDNLQTRNTATSKLRRWFGKTTTGEDYLPRNQGRAGYAFRDDVNCDILRWDAIIQHTPLEASTATLEAALKLVRGIPFEGVHPRRYAWAEPVRQRLIAEIVDASYELTRRRLLAGQPQAAEQACRIGLLVEPAQEPLWRLRILAARELGDQTELDEAIERLLAITDGLEAELEPESVQLLNEIRSRPRQASGQ